MRARTINEEMKLAAAQAIAGVIPEDELHEDYIVPSVFNRRVAESVAEAVAAAAVASGVARRKHGLAQEPLVKSRHHRGPRRGAALTSRGTSRRAARNARP